MEICDWEECFKLECGFCDDIFWKSINVWILKPHILNKRIGGVDVFDIGPLNSESVLKCYDYFKQNLSTKNISGLWLKDLVDDYKKKEIHPPQDCNYDVSLRFLYPKTGEYLGENVEFLVKDKDRNLVTFVKPIKKKSNVYPMSMPYTIRFEGKSLRLLVPIGNTQNDSVIWIRSTLFPKLVRWMNPEFQKNSVHSNKLISTEQYVMTYNKIKNKYYSSILEMWNESTNPQKFIIEDIAIASYLLVLWGEVPQKFVDLGCGNGLLVYILNCENHIGVGLDIRARKIWKSYPESTVLKEVVITPSLDCVFPNTDWIIGNHSDELTPWIPVIAAKSSYTTNFFLLPCCLFEFDGNKYARSHSSKTCYEEYMNYVEHISQICGFEVEKDRLKIPSTKRLCFVGRKRYVEMEEGYRGIIDDFVLSKLDTTKKVKLRESKEKVRNCTQLSKDFLSAVVMDVANYILSTTNHKTSWREGEFTLLQDLIKLLSPEWRQNLKNECGGLQTLLKNHHHIFVVREGKVKLRKPSPKARDCNFVKTKNCWFYLNHPDSCPLNDDECSYIHSK